MKNIFFTSDWHIDHLNIIKFSNRPFKDCNEMHDCLIKRYKSCVSDDAIVYFLGDMGKNQDSIRSIISQIPGTKILILGNHDKKMVSGYMSGFDVVLNSAILNVGDSVLTLSHYPLEGVYREDTTKMGGRVEGDNWYGESRCKNNGVFLFKNMGETHSHLHGHIHSPNKGQSATQLGNQWDVGVDGNNFSPVSLKSVISWIDIRKNLKTHGFFC